jgi:hypothetical protein
MQTLRITVKVTFSSPVSHEQEERSRPDYGPEMAARGTRCRPVNQSRLLQSRSDYGRLMSVSYGNYLALLLAI